MLDEEEFVSNDDVPVDEFNRPLVCNGCCERIDDDVDDVNDNEPGTIDLRLADEWWCLLPVAAATATAAAALKRLVEFDRERIGDEPHETEALFKPVVPVFVPSERPYLDANIDDAVDAALDADNPPDWPGLNDCRWWLR